MNNNYPLTKERIPLTERDIRPEMNIDEKFQQKRENDPNRFKDVRSSCTFQPDLKNTENDMRRSVASTHLNLLLMEEAAEWLLKEKEMCLKD